MQNIQQILLQCLLSNTIESCKENQTTNRYSSSKKRKNFNSNKMHNNYDKRNNKRKGFRKRRIQIKQIKNKVNIMIINIIQIRNLNG